MSNEYKVIKSVAFNKRNPDEKLILEAVRRRNFSKYVKKLLLEDINKKISKTEPTPTPESRPLTTSEQLSALKRKG